MQQGFSNSIALVALIGQKCLWLVGRPGHELADRAKVRGLPACQDEVT